MSACLSSAINMLGFFVWLRGVCTQAPCYCIIMEYCAQGQLYEVLRAGRKVTPRMLVDWASGIASGMNYLHLHKIIHRDLKSPKWVPEKLAMQLFCFVFPWSIFWHWSQCTFSLHLHFSHLADAIVHIDLQCICLLCSVLVTHNDAVKISDFGTSKELSDKSTKMSFAGTVAWMAPEVIRNEPVSEKVDIWWVSRYHFKTRITFRRLKCPLFVFLLGRLEWCYGNFWPERFPTKMLTHLPSSGVSAATVFTFLSPPPARMASKFSWNKHGDLFLQKLEISLPRDVSVGMLLTIESW